MVRFQMLVEFLYGYSDTSGFSWFRLLYDLVGVVDIILQTYNFIVIYVATPKSMHGYRFYLYFQTICDLFFELWYLLVVAPVLVRMPGCITFRSRLDLSNEYMRIEMAIVFFLGSLLICAQHYSCLYRFMVITKAEDDTVVHGFNRPFMKCIGVGILLMISATVGFCAYEIAADDQYVESAYHLVTAEREKQEHRIVKKKIYWWCLDWSNRLPWYYTIGTLFLASQIMNFIGFFAIIRLVKSVQNRLTPATYKMHVTLSILLCIQGLVPLFCMVIPMVFILVIGRLFNLPYVADLTRILFMLIGAFPLINGILVVTFIGPYRRFAISLWRRLWCIKRTVNVAPVVVSQTRTQGLVE
ncbi:serpentine type 7TM GPCR chemoreceptor srh domain-containing protein [Ditylenchus destructor]|uniref:Serpentine type 7TM GPCR chemoreceptor srh domain-containing protein n=1 Tax=Ditylenchus destructor TaxID=166010 RepID=A0AAD4MK69_9BILA|nr:serpentine type 7TM GPCR chemoreceptor srh domain-containing protein [Ditylenchus destructor]